MTDQNSLAAAIHEAVVLQPYDGRWPALFTTERDRLLSCFPGSFIDIQHIGSTAVPGLLAKPVIDLLAGVESMVAAEALLAPLCANGYTGSAEFNASLTDRKWLMRWAEGRRTHHLHLVVHGGAVWAQRLRFRDALRSDPALAVRYAALKAELAAKHPNDREAYTDGKTAFVKAACEG
ncbi:MAG: GrpB family protein [Polaromonas sp.]|uniref:GrpB family protein n=1 Tax=Polaromonas sp. TaxID=1869339 RepID=UPI003264680F